APIFDLFAFAEFRDRAIVRAGIEYGPDDLRIAAAERRGKVIPAKRPADFPRQLNPGAIVQLGRFHQRTVHIPDRGPGGLSVHASSSLRSGVKSVDPAIMLVP